MADTKTEDLSSKKSAATARKEYICVIADKIQSLIRDENFAPNDIMVLVQRRNPFALPLVNQLKSRGIDVAGSDRIVLPEFPAIRDLLNLIRFCINVDDDYSLCCTLKSPLYRLKEDEIFKICTKRNNMQKDTKTNIFSILKDSHPDIFSELSDIIEWSKTLAPYSFFSKVLNTNNHREKMISALGTQIIDPLEEFLTICLAYERTMPGTLRHFLKWFILGASEIKRDMDASSGVRIVTVHGSKGLEAPIVFLIDTTRTPQDKPERVFPLSAGNEFATWLWAPKTVNSEKLNELANASLDSKIAEYYRLLYVAMTRARDRLYVYGFTTNKNPSAIAWHTQLVNILKDIPNATMDNNIIKVSND